MVFELYGIAKVTGKKEEKRLFRTRYVVAYEANVDGQRVTGTKRVNFDEYSQINVGDNINFRLFSGDGRTATSLRIDAGLESLFGAFVHPSLRKEE